jgi:hypothetical protein
MEGMRSFSFLLPLFLMGGCTGAETGVIPAECSEPPSVPVTTRSGEILQLDVVQLGENIRQQPGTFASLGMNLDGRCSTSDDSTQACMRVPGSPRQRHADGEHGIDNAFGSALLPMLKLLEERPSESASGTSFLVLEGGGRATLHLGARPGRSILSVPITSVRLDEDRLDGLVTLAGVIPPAELRASFAAHANALLDPPEPELCSGSAMAGVLQGIDQAPDVRLDGAPNEGAQCDGISIGFRFRASPASRVPELPPPCP